MANNERDMLANAIADANARLRVIADASNDSFIVSGLESEMETEKLLLMREKQVWITRPAVIEREPGMQASAIRQAAGNAR